MSKQKLPKTNNNNKLNLQELNEQQINESLSQGITLDQIAQIATEQGQSIPPVVKQMMEQQIQTLPEQQAAMAGNQVQQGMVPSQPQSPLKSSKFPTMMSVNEYKNYQNVVKEKEVIVEESSSEISMSTLIVDEGGKFNQTSLSNALKKGCDKLVTKLLGEK